MIVSGTRMGPYTVLGSLGAGGMGEVYRAQDERLGREVALKLLPPEFAEDSLRLSLFRREALTLAALNHPGIATIFGFEEPQPRTLFLVLELVPGESLSERLARGPLGIEEAIRVAIQVAEAVVAAHARDVIHRDLKPSNIMLGPRGRVKVLDFGLARKLRRESPSRSVSGSTIAFGESAGVDEPRDAALVDDGNEDATLVAATDQTIIVPSNEDATVVAGGTDETLIVDPSSDKTLVAGTDSDETMIADSADSTPETRDTTVSEATSGITTDSRASLDELSELGDDVAGTAGYMSPEQILGRAQDGRADVFALGCILYEAITGERAFLGKRTRDTLTKTLTKTVDFSLLPEKTPDALRSILTRCLEKEPEDRPANMGVVQVELEDILGIRHAAERLDEEGADLPDSNLPPVKGALVGRDEELAACLKSVTTSKLLTLTGVGGTGKTRLALEAARRLRPEFADGIWFVDLAPIQQAERVVPTLVHTLGLREEPGLDPLQILLDHLRSKTMLILLDNCEHLLEACADVVSRARSVAPGLHVLATSREALAIAGEHIYPVPPLAVPRAEAGADVHAIESNASVQLFMARARQAFTDFDLTAGNAADVAEVCRQLDGIPLAIELAAARVGALGIDEIRAKLDDRFKLLTGGSEGALPRQQTLRATMQWSYDHLAPLEQEMLLKLSVFTGGWSLDSASAVWDEDADEFEVLDLLTRLIDKSLVLVSPGSSGDNRYRYLETVRQYAAERFEEQETVDPVRRRHLQFFLELAHTTEPKLVGPEQAQWLGRLDEDHANLLSALRWSREDPSVAVHALQLAGDLSRYWSIRGLYDLAKRTLVKTLDCPGTGDPTPARAKALVRAGGMAVYRGDIAESGVFIEESLEVYRALGDEKGVSRARSGLATVAIYRNDFAAARRYNEEVLASYRAKNDTRGAAVTLHNLGFVSLCQGRFAEAIQSYEEAIPLLREVGDLAHIALTMADLAVATARMGNRLAAAGRLQVSLSVSSELGAKREIAYGIEAAAELALLLEEPASAARWQAAAQAWRESVNSSVTPAEAEQRATVSRAIERALGDRAYAEAQSDGRSRGFDSNLEDVLNWLNRIDLSSLSEE